MVDNTEYKLDICDKLMLCENDSTQHAIVIMFDSESGFVQTYGVNAEYVMSRMLVQSAARIFENDEERKVN